MSHFPQYIDLLGAIIQCAIVDYQTIDPNSRMNGIYYTSAKHYLFSENGLEGFLKRTGSEELLNINYVRRMADKYKIDDRSHLTKGRRNISSVKFEKPIL